MIRFFLEGFIIGLGKIIPGVSGALFAMLFGVYEDIIKCISSPKYIIKNYKMILPLIIGIAISIVFGSGLIKVLLEIAYLQSMAFFIGMMSFEIIPLIKKNRKVHLKRGETILLTSLIMIMLLLMFIPINYNRVISIGVFRDVVSIFLCGILDAIATIIPGISGTSLLMLAGYYEIIISSISSLHLPVLLPFIIGLFSGIVFLAKMIDYAFKYHKSFMNTAVLCLAILSTIILTLELVNKLSTKELTSTVLFLTIGFAISFLLETKLT